VKVVPFQTFFTVESDMSTENKPNFVRINLTEEQKTQVRTETGKEAEAVELTAKELEERIAPRVANW
jgi:hypothetical protein